MPSSQVGWVEQDVGLCPNSGQGYLEINKGEGAVISYLGKELAILKSGWHLVRLMEL